MAYGNFGRTKDIMEGSPLLNGKWKARRIANRAYRQAKREQRRAGKTSGCGRGRWTRGGYGSTGCAAPESMA
jgi:hypothetical protein